ncbi:MAG: hypothetical protein ABIS06_12680 [Vicinamibacterales bacterium]
MRRVSAPTILTGLVMGIAIWVSFSSLALTDAASGRRIGLLAPLWLLALSTAASVALLCGLDRVRHVRHVAVWSVLILLPWLPIPVPDAFLIWTGPVVVLVWTAIGLCALPLLSGHITRRPVRFLFDARIAPRVACALAFVASVSVHYKQQLPPAGDEPHYLLVAHSLLVDHDLKVANNYERADYLTYYAGPLTPHYARAGSQYSGHGPGLPVLIAPALAVGGYRAVVLWIAAIGALGTLFVWKAAHALTSDVTAAWVAWAGAALTAPLVLQSTLIYPDSVAGTVLSAGVLAMLTAASLSMPRAAVLGVGIGLLPWLHTRFAPVAGIMAIVVACRLMGTPGGWRRWSPALLGLGVPIIASVTAWFLADVYGTFDPMAAFDGRAHLQPERMVSGLLGLVGDQEFGLIVNAPVHLLWIGGAFALARRHKRLLVELALVAGPYVLVVAAFPVWFGGSTPARYLAPLVFPLAVMLAPLWSRQDDFGRSVSMALLIVSVLIAGAFGFGGSGILAYNSGSGRSAWLDWVAPTVNLPGGFPSYFRAIPAEGPARGSIWQELMLPAGIWTIISIATWSLARWLHDRCAPETINRATLAVACLVAVLSAGVATTWAITKVPHLMATRAQLALLAHEDPRASRLGVELKPFRIMSSDKALQRLEISTSPLGTPSTSAMLHLSEVPPGDYQLRLSVAAEPRGTLSLLVGGGGGGPIVTWDLSAVDNTYRFRIPIPTSAVTIVGDTEAVRAVRSVTLIPIRRITTPWTAVTRARAAARYGHAVVYAIDNRIVLEPDGFWVLGGRQPDVVITTDGSRARLTFQVSNVAIPNRVRISNGAWSETRDLAPDERWLVTVPLRDSAQPARLNFRVERGASVGGRLLGCRVSIVQ